MTDPTSVQVAGRLAGTRSRRQVLSAIGKGTAAGAGVVLVARPLGIIDTQLTAMAQAAASVGIVDFAFNPGSVAVDESGTVTWTNQGPSLHTVTADDGSFDSGQLAAGASFSYTFASAGTVSYHCAIHPDMVGSVVVSGGSTDTPAATDSAAAAVLPATGAGSGMTELSPWLGVALAGGAAAWIAGRELRKASPVEE